MFSQPSSERPRERLAQHGAEALSQIELLALLIGTGTAGRSGLDLARDLLATAGDLAGLARLDADSLARRPGLGAAKAARIAAALELGRRAMRAGPPALPQLTTLAHAARVVAPELAHAAEERLVVLLLDRRDRLLRLLPLLRGTVDGLSLRPRDVLRPALEAGAAALVLAHNHPSGDPTPSREDRLATRRLVRAGAVVGVEVRDHLVVAGARWVAIRAGAHGSWIHAPDAPTAPAPAAPSDLRLNRSRRGRGAPAR